MKKNRPMRVSILGTRGVPANYGGFETFAEETGARLAEMGCEVSVYCRPGDNNRGRTEYRGMKLILLPTIRHKYMETIVHAFFSSLHVMFQQADIVYYCNSINSIFMIFPRLAGKKVLMNVDGLEWKRTKWSKIGKLAYQVSEFLATVLADVIISDSRRIRLYYQRKFRAKSELISYGASGIPLSDGQNWLSSMGLEERRYCLYVSRLEPENNAHLFVRAYEKATTDFPLVVVGHAPYGAPYINALRATKDPRIRFLGPIYGEKYRLLLSHAYLYFHGNAVGGTNPALLEAMATGNCVLTIGVSFNREVVGRAGYWFKWNSPSDLLAKMQYLLDSPEAVETIRPLAAQRVRRLYNWDDVTQMYYRLFSKLCGFSGAPPAREEIIVEMFPTMEYANSHREAETSV